MTFAYTAGNCLFLGLDEFKSKQVGINQDWLDKTLAAPHPQHIFAFAHKMAFRSGHHDDGFETDPPARDKFMNSLSGAGARMVFFGHDHLYDRRSAKLADWPDSKSIHQVVVGTAGAPFVKGSDEMGDIGNWQVTKLGHVEGKLGYCVVDVDGPKVTMTFKAETSPGVFETADTFSYTLGS